MQPSNTQFDAIVAGSGPGGATVARELTLAGKKVLILEWGDNEPTRGSAAQFISQAVVPGKSMLITRQMLGMVRAIVTGGSSMIYCGTAFDPAVDMLKSHGVDISREADEIANDVPISPLSDDLMGKGPTAFLNSARDLGHDAHKLNKFIYQDKCRAECQLCMYGCPFGAKWNARHFAIEAMEKGATLIPHAKVKRVIVENKTAVGVEYVRNKQTLQAFAPLTIVSAGGIGSPLILRESGLRGTGFDFFFDPLIFVFGKIPGLASGKSIPMSAGVHFAQDGVMMTDFNMPRLLKILFDLQVFKFRQAFAYHDVLPIMIKIRDDLGGRITRLGLVDKNLTREDRLKLDKGAEQATRVLKNAGATEIYRSWMLAAHPGGTVKIGEYVDTDLKTRFDGLYVCDCSVMPQELGLPPTATLLCLGKRLAKHLLAKGQKVAS